LGAKFAWQISTREIFDIALTPHLAHPTAHANARPPRSAKVRSKAGCFLRLLNGEWVGIPFARVNRGAPIENSRRVVADPEKARYRLTAG
jgi:hypothetical protein